MYDVLRDDYTAMRAIIFSDAPSSEIVAETIAALGGRVNEPRESMITARRGDADNCSR